MLVVGRREVFVQPFYFLQQLLVIVAHESEQRKRSVEGGGMNFVRRYVITCALDTWTMANTHTGCYHYSICGVASTFVFSVYCFVVFLVFASVTDVAICSLVLLHNRELLCAASSLYVHRGSASQPHLVFCIVVSCILLVS